MNIENLAAKFDGYHAENQKMAADIASIAAEVEEQATNIVALGLSGGVKNALVLPINKLLGDLQGFVQAGPRAEMSITVDPEGGFTTTSDMDSAIGQVAEDLSPMRRISRVVMTSASEWKLVFNTGQAASGWVGEKAARPETATPSLSEFTFYPNEIYANPAMTQQLLDDSKFDIGEFMRHEIVKEFTRQEDAAFVNGDGIKKPHGFLSYSADAVTTDDATRDFGVLQYVASGDPSGFPTVAGASNPDALVTLVYKVQSQYRGNGRWLMNSATAGDIRKLKDADGRYLWREPLIADQPALLLGYPVEIEENMPDIGANAFPIAFGDFRAGYCIVDRLGMRLLRDPFTNKPYVMFYATKRVDGNLVDSRAIKLLKIAT